MMTRSPVATFSCRPPASTIANIGKCSEYPGIHVHPGPAGHTGTYKGNTWRAWGSRQARLGSSGLGLGSRRVAGHDPGPKTQDPRLFEENPRAPDLLRTERVQEARQQAVHQLEVGRERRRVLVLRIEALLVEALAVEHLAGAAVDEHELRRERVAFQVAVGAGFLVTRDALRVDERGRLVDHAALFDFGEQHRAGDDQRHPELGPDFF